MVRQLLVSFYEDTDDPEYVQIAYGDTTFFSFDCALTIQDEEGKITDLNDAQKEMLLKALLDDKKEQKEFLNDPCAHHVRKPSLSPSLSEETIAIIKQVEGAHERAKNSTLQFDKKVE